MSRVFTQVRVIFQISLKRKDVHLFILILSHKLTQF